MKRTPMNRATPGALAWQRKKRKALARVGKRGKVRKQEWAEAKAAHLYVEPACQFKTWVESVGVEDDAHWAVLLPVLTGPCRAPLDVHHVIPRGSGGGKDYGVYATLCRGHHDWVESHREAGRALGLLMRPPSHQGESQ